MLSDTLFHPKPRAALQLPPVRPDVPLTIIEDEECYDTYFGSEPADRLQRQASKGGLGRPRIRHSETGLSCQSHLSAISQMSAMKAPHPNMRRSTTALSCLSQKTGSSNNSNVPPELGLEIGRLRGHSTVGYNVDWPVTDDYDFEEPLGEGGFGQVFMAKQKGTEEKFAIKRIPAVSVKDIQRYEREIRVFERLTSPYVVRLLEIFRDDRYLYLVMDLCQGGDLMHYLMNYWTDPDHPDRQQAISMYPNLHHTLPVNEVGCLVWQMLAGIAYLHHHRFLHRDVKLENYMLKTKIVNPQLLLCDFGLSIRLNKGEKASGTVGTLLYMAPEVIGGSYDHKCDIWSVGVSAYIVATMCSPWGSSSDENDVKRRILMNRREGWPKVDRPTEMKKLIDRMMTPTPEQRPTAKDLYATSRWLRKHRHHIGGQNKGTNCSIA